MTDMAAPRVIDAYPACLQFWATARDEPLERRIERWAGEPVQRFFGSWYAIEGHSQCGYFLGCEAVRELESALSLSEIARLAEPTERLRPVLAQFAG